MKATLCILALAFSILSTAMGFGFMGGTALSGLVKFLCGFVFIMAPLWVVQLILLLYKKGK